jgi:NADP-dependent 3-hydroxy acid dehydrogenase YdfG
LLINNAGISTGHNLLTGGQAEIRREPDTHFWGTLGMVRAYAPILAANGGGAILNVLSALSWSSYDGAGASQPGASQPSASQPSASNR